MSWIFLALSGTFLFACSNILDKVLSTKYLKNPVALAASFGIFGTIFSAFLFMNVGVPHIPFPNLAAAFAGGVVWAYAGIPYLKALSLEEASRVVPMWHFAPVFTMVFAIIFLNEILTWQGYAAFALILTGGFLVSTRHTGGMFHISPAVIFMLLSSFLFGTSDVLLKFAYNAGMFWETFLVTLLGSCLSQLLLFTFPAAREGFSRAFISYKHVFAFLIFLSSITGFSGDIFWNRAVFSAPVTLVSVFISFHSLFVLVLATIFSVKFPLFIKEAVDAKTIGLKAAAIILMASGLLLLSVS